MDSAVEVHDGSGSTVATLDADDLSARDLAAVAGTVWVVGAHGVRAWKLPVKDSTKLVRLPNGVAALGTWDGRIFGSFENQIVEITDSGVKPIFQARRFVKDFEVRGDELWVATPDAVLHIDASGSVTRTGSGANRLGVDDGRVIVSEFLGNGAVDGIPLPGRFRGDPAVGGGRVFRGDNGGRLEIRDLSTGEVVHAVDAGQSPWGLALSSDGRQAAYALEDHGVRLVDLETGTTEILTPFHRSSVPSLDFSPDGNRLASASWDGTSFVWRDGQLEAALEAHQGRVVAVRFIDDETLATGSWDQTIRRWSTRAWTEPIPD